MYPCSMPHLTLAGNSCFKPASTSACGGKVALSTTKMLPVAERHDVNRNALNDKGPPEYC